MPDTDKYKNLLSDLIKKQMVMLGPSVALGNARKVSGITIGDDGTVIEISADPQTVMAGIAKVYMNLSGQIAQNTLDSILAKYPEVKNPNA